MYLLKQGSRKVNSKKLSQVWLMCYIMCNDNVLNYAFNKIIKNSSHNYMYLKCFSLCKKL